MTEDQNGKSSLPKPVFRQATKKVILHLEGEIARLLQNLASEDETTINELVTRLLEKEDARRHNGNSVCERPECYRKYWWKINKNQ